MLLSCLIDADRIDTANFEYGCFSYNTPSISWDSMIEKLESQLLIYSKESGSNPSEINVNSVRKEVSDNCKRKSLKLERGIYTLTVPTGGGKTLSSLRFALHHAKKHNMDHIFYIVPFTTIIEQNAGYVKKILEDKESSGKIVLEYHSNIFYDGNDESQKHLNILSENWSAPIVFTTMVQFLDTLFDHKTNKVRRLHQFSNSVIIFDEIQAIPVNCMHMFCNAIYFLVHVCNCSVLLCTATQPLLNNIDCKQGSLQIDSEIMDNVPDLFHKLHRVEFINKTKEVCKISDIVSLALEKAKEYRSCLIIVNTTKVARDIYNALSSSDLKIYHLSANMYPKHRESVLDQLKKDLSSHENNIPIICVSTQVIEAGVNIDFGTVIRSIAGLDSIAQAAGRCNRNGKKLEISPVYIINPSEEHLKSLPTIDIGKKITTKILKSPKYYGSDLLSPETISKYFKEFNNELKSSMNYPVSKKNQKLNHDDNLVNLLGSNQYSVAEYKRIHDNQSPELSLLQSFETAGEIFNALDSLSCGVIIEHGEGINIICQLLSDNLSETDAYRLLKLSQSYAVNIYPDLFKNLLTNHAIIPIEKYGVYYLKYEYYNDFFGVTGEQEKKGDFLIV